MALLASMYLRGAKQRLGGAVLYSSAGRTIARELASSVSNPRTPSQMAQRVKWANLVQFYKANKGWMKKAFENKMATQSDYNKFMQMNIATARVYLAKPEAASGACVVDAFKVTDGSLPPVAISQEGGNWNTNLFVTPEFNLTENSTVAEFSSILVGKNPTLRVGDQLSFIRVTQVTDQLGTPRIQVRAYEMIVNTNNPALVADYLPLDVMAVSDDGEGNYFIAVINNNNSGAFAIVISRTAAGKTAVSPATLTLVNMDDMLRSYSSATQLEVAAASYGVGDDVFLDSDNANPSSNDPTLYSLLYVKVGSETAVAGVTFFRSGDLYDNRIVATFNKPVTIASGDVIRVTDDSGRVATIAPNVSGNSVYFDGDTQTLGALTSDAEVKTLDVVLGGVVHTFRFGSRNVD